MLTFLWLTLPRQNMTLTEDILKYQPVIFHHLQLCQRAVPLRTIIGPVLVSPQLQQHNTNPASEAEHVWVSLTTDDGLLR